MLKKQYLIIAAAFVLILTTVIFWVVGSKPAAKPKSPAQNRLALPPPRFQPAIESPPGVIFSYVGPSPAIPAVLGVYRISPSPSLTVIQRQALGVARNLGFTASPSAFIRKQNYAASWEEKDTSLSFAKSGATRALSYQLLRSGVSGPPVAVDETLIKKFLKNIQPESSLLPLRPYGMQGNRFDGLLVLDQPPPTLSSYAYSFVLDQYPLLTPELSPVSVSLVIDDRGAVRSLSYVFPPEGITKTGDTALLSLEDVVYGLTAGRGLLLSAQNPGEDWEGVTPNFQKVELSALAVVYVQDNEQLQPAFLLSGTGVSGGGGQRVEYLIMAGK